MLPDDPTSPDPSTASSPESPPPTGVLEVPVAPVTVGPTGRAARGRSWIVALCLVLVAVMGGGALFLSGYTVGRDQAGSPGTPAEEVAAWQPFWDVYKNIRDRFPLGPVDQKTLVEGAIRGLVASIGDPYSSYLSPEDFSSTLEDISGQFEGIGAEIGTVDGHGDTVDCNKFGPDCRLVIIAPIEGSPAEAAGLKPGDIIEMIDGSKLDGLTPDQARDRVRGKAGTKVTLHIVRLQQPAVPSGPPTASTGPSPLPSGPAASEAPEPTPKVLQEFDVTLERAKIQRKEVTSKDLAGGTVGYVRLSGFSDAGADATVAAVKDFVGRGVKKIVFDLRGNPGGFLTAARTVASAFIASGPIYWQQDAQGQQVETDALGNGVATDPSIQVVVLIDKGSASASEIVAGALQDRGRAKLIGETSFGKGTVQEWIGLDDLGGVKLTTWKWLTPNKRWIHTVGLTPDVPVTTPANLPPGQDPVLDKALEVLGAPSAFAELPQAA